MTAFVLWLEFEHWDDEDDDPENDFFNMIVTVGETVYALNVWTYAFIESARAHDRATGDCLHGSYTMTPDLLVERMDRALMERVVADLIAADAMQAAWRVPRKE